MRRFCLAASIGIVSFAIAFNSCTPSPEGTYIPFEDGEASRVLLLDAELRYGTYDKDIPHLRAKVFVGDDAVIISGTIRNDYEEDYYVAISASLYNPEGEKVGTVLSPSAPIPGFAVARVTRGSTSPFEIWVKYDRQDVMEYELFLPYQPSTWPFP